MAIGTAHQTMVTYGHASITVDGLLDPYRSFSVHISYAQSASATRPMRPGERAVMFCKCTDNDLINLRKDGRTEVR
jgi:hypothetical protein